MKYLNLSFTFFLLLMSVSVSAEMNKQNYSYTPQIHKHTDLECVEIHIHANSYIPRRHKHADTDCPLVHKHPNKNGPESHSHTDTDDPKMHKHSDSDSPKMYKYTDSEGVTTFSDIKVEGATEIRPVKSNTIVMPKPVLRKKTAEEPKPAAYSAFIIVSPQHDATVRNNNGIVTLGLSLTPELNIDSGHGIWAYIDDQMVVSNNTSLIISINNVYRGSHTIYAVVRDSKKNSLIKSETITIHFKQASSLH